jgi:hypothetical protein
MAVIDPDIFYTYISVHIGIHIVSIVDGSHEEDTYDSSRSGSFRFSSMEIFMFRWASWLKAGLGIGRVSLSNNQYMPLRNIIPGLQELWHSLSWWWRSGGTLAPFGDFWDGVTLEIASIRWESGGAGGVGEMPWRGGECPWSTVWKGAPSTLGGFQGDHGPIETKRGIDIREYRFPADGEKAPKQQRNGRAESYIIDMRYRTQATGKRMKMKRDEERWREMKRRWLNE